MITKKRKSELWGLAATACSLIASLWYNKAILLGQSKPNLSSWLVWVFICILHAFSYKEVTQKGWAQRLLPFLDSILCAITTIIVCFYGSFGDLNKFEWTCFGLGVLAAIVWKIFQSATWAQVLLQAAIIIGGLPTLFGVWHVPAREPLFSWVLWTFTFTAQFFAVKVDWDGKWVGFLYPVCMIIFHALVVAVIIR